MYPVTARSVSEPRGTDISASINVDVCVRGGPIDRSVKLFDRARRHLNQTVAGLAIPQGIDVIAFKRKTLQVGKLRRIAEHPESQIVGELAKAVEIAGKPKVALRSCMDVDRPKQENFCRRAGRQAFATACPLRIATI
jgi:hypothetical protein